MFPSSCRRLLSHKLPELLSHLDPQPVVCWFLKTETPEGTHLIIRLLKTHLVIFGEVRYCRAVADGFHVGVLIEHMFNAREELGKHLHDMDLCFYVLGKGLTVEEVILLKDHLMTCETCQVRVAKKEAALHPVSGPKNKTQASGKD